MAIIGIDLGTTNSLVSHWTESGAVIIPNVHGSNLTPSVVSVDDTDEILIGQAAKERQISHPHNTVSTFKRFMGTQKKYQLGNYSFSPEELSAMILKSLKADAEHYLGEEIVEAVISVPAYFNDMQRTATKHAAELAGLKVERLISEPTAAALAYGLHQKELETKFMVFDLGGGTFDVSILEHFAGVLEVQSVAGDNYLGGEDFTELLIAHFSESNNIIFNNLNQKEKAALYKQAELCKIELSENESSTMSVSYGDQTYTKTYNREEYERLANKMLLKLKKPVERAMRDASISAKDLDAVILIGGATRMQLVRSTVGRMFSKLPYTHINPDEAVAIGAAIQAALKVRNKSFDELILTDVCPYTLGIGISRPTESGGFDTGLFSPIIERNSPIPISRVETYGTLKDNQTTIILDIFQGENWRVEDNVKLGTMTLHVPKNKAGVELVDVRFTYDINGILEVETTVKSIGARSRMLISNGNSTMTEQEMKASFNRLKELKIHPRDKMENRLLIERGARLYEESLGGKRDFITERLLRFERVLSAQNLEEIKIASIELKEIFDNMERGFE
jgi:molecular chaperone HscC